MYRILIDLAAYYAAWAGAAFAAASNRPDLAAVACLAAVALHLATSESLPRTLRLLLLAGLIGGIVETAFVALGATSFKSAELGTGLPPVWSAVLWPAFATLIPRVLSFLDGRPLIAALLGGVAAPLAYLGGSSLGALTVNAPQLQSLAIIALAWAIALPVLTTFWRRQAT